MKKLVTLSLVCLMAVSTAFAAGKKTAPKKVVNPDKYPAFSWDKLNVCLHFSKSQDDFSPEEVAIIAKYPVICIEKTQASGKNGGADIGTSVAAKAIKAVNPNVKVLSYFNLKLDYNDLYSTGTIMGPGGPHPEWRLTDAKGKEQGGPKRFKWDLSNKECIEWWKKRALEFGNLEGVDGLFIDALTANLNFPDRQAKQFGEEKYKKIQEGAIDIIETLSTQLDHKIVIGNGSAVIKGMPADYGLDLVEKIDGAMTEHFCDLSGKDKDNIVAAIELIRQVALRERIFVVKGWPRYNFTNDEIRDKKRFTQQQLIEMAREDITFPLACFLCGAGKYSYFCYSWGYREDQGGLVDYAEYNKPLGEPKGDYVKKGYIFTREFAHASVWVDVENRQAKIDWK